MYSDITPENDALSRGVIHFSVQMTKKFLSFLNPPLPPWTFFSRIFIFSLETYSSSPYYPLKKFVGTQLLESKNKYFHFLNKIWWNGFQFFSLFLLKTVIKMINMNNYRCFSSLIMNIYQLSEKSFCDPFHPI